MVTSFYSLYDLKAMLTTSGFTFDKHVHQYRSQVTNEVTGTGYTPGGTLVLGFQVLLNAASSRVDVIADEANFGPLTVSGIANIVVYQYTGNPATERILACHSLSPTVSVDNRQFSYYFAGDTTGTTAKGIITSYNY